MGIKTTAFATILLKNTFRVEDYYFPIAVYASAHTADPGVAGTQTTSEASFSNYSRTSLQFADLSVTDGVLTNGVDIEFAQHEGTTPVTITHIGLGEDSSGSGTLYYRLALSTPYVWLPGQILRIPAGELNVTED